MPIMYKVKDWGYEIKIIEVDKYNDKSVWIKGRREGRDTSYCCYYPDFESAKNYQIEKANTTIRNCENKIAQAKQALELLQNLSEPQQV